MTKPNEPTLTCSEVVERLAECLEMAINLFADDKECRQEGTDAFDWIWRARHAAEDYREQSPAILHSWRERRVQELEEALRTAAIHLGNFANEKNWSDEAGCLQWIAKRHAIEFAKEAQAEAKNTLVNSGWREQIRKGAKHEL